MWSKPVGLGAMRTLTDIARLGYRRAPQGPLRRRHQRGPRPGGRDRSGLPCGSSRRARARGASRSTRPRTSRAFASGAPRWGSARCSCTPSICATSRRRTRRSSTRASARCSRRSMRPSRWADGVVFHVGSHLGAGFEAGLEQCVPALEQVLERAGEATWLLLELGRRGRHDRQLRRRARCSSTRSAGIRGSGSASTPAISTSPASTSATERLMTRRSPSSTGESGSTGCGRSPRVNDAATPLGSNRDRHRERARGRARRAPRRVPRASRGARPAGRDGDPGPGGPQPRRRRGGEAARAAPALAAQTTVAADATAALTGACVVSTQASLSPARARVRRAPPAGRRPGSSRARRRSRTRRHGQQSERRVAGARRGRGRARRGSRAGATPAPRPHSPTARQVAAAGTSSRSSATTRGRGCVDPSRGRELHALSLPVAAAPFHDFVAGDERNLVLEQHKPAGALARSALRGVAPELGQPREDAEIRAAARGRRGTPGCGSRARRRGSNSRVPPRPCTSRAAARSRMPPNPSRLDPQHARGRDRARRRTRVACSPRTCAPRPRTRRRTDTSARCTPG